VGIVAALLGTMFVKVDGSGNKHLQPYIEKMNKGNPAAALRNGTFVTGGILIVVSLVVTKAMLGDLNIFWAVVSGVVAGVLIGFVTEIYTSGDYSGHNRPASETDPRPLFIRIAVV
jgi:K(+)-stimulated pyrophosphate-energized sodium pump